MVPLLFALVAGMADVIAGALALRGATARLQSRYVIAFGAGVLLAATFFDVLPEVDLKADAFALAAGFVAFYLLEKVTMLHACGEDECEAHHIGPSAVIGMALDNVVDGASDFIYIGASDLLPEAHRRFNATVIVSVLAGMAFVLGLRAVFPVV